MPVLAFVFICVMLMPFGLGPELSLLQRLAPGLLWVIMLMAVLLSLDRMFQADFEDGSLDQLMLLPVALEWAVIAKVCAHFAGILLPVLAMMPLAGTLDVGALGVLGLISAASIFLAPPAIAAALRAGLR
jgi:heme exporter protein B